MTQVTDALHLSLHAGDRHIEFALPLLEKARIVPHIHSMLYVTTNGLLLFVAPRIDGRESRSPQDIVSTGRENVFDFDVNGNGRRIALAHGKKGDLDIIEYDSHIGSWTFFSARIEPYSVREGVRWLTDDVVYFIDDRGRGHRVTRKTICGLCPKWSL